MSASTSLGTGMFASAAGWLAGLAGVLVGWLPDAFWAATPAELAGVLRALAPEEAAPLAGVDIARLQEMYPDG